MNFKKKLLEITDYSPQKTCRGLHRSMGRIDVLQL